MGSYYPFGLKHKGYNNVINGTDHKYGYNGVEEQDELGLNMLSMDLRQYDPAIARWTSIDPVVHYSFSTYNAFDNNPVFFADPSGADSETLYGMEARDAYRNIVYSLGGATDNNDTSDNDCDSCETEEDWEIYYSQAENTASQLGEDAWGSNFGRLTRMKTEDGEHWNFFIDGEHMDIVRHKNRLSAFFSVVDPNLFLINVSANIFKALAFSDEIARVGKSSKNVVESSISKLKGLHGVPRDGKPLNYIDDLAKSIKNNGYDISQAIPVIKMPNGTNVIAGGHHRVAAMKQLGQTSIPSTMTNWSSLTVQVQNRLLSGPNGAAYKNYLK